MTTKQKEAARAEAIATLKSLVFPGDRFEVIIHTVSRSGMQRTMSFYHGRTGRNYTREIAAVLDGRLDKEDHLVVGGSGMDMIFHVLSNLSYAMSGPRDKPLPRRGKAFLSYLDVDALLRKQKDYYDRCRKPAKGVTWDMVKWDYNYFNDYRHLR